MINFILPIVIGALYGLWVGFMARNGNDSSIVTVMCLCALGGATLCFIVISLLGVKFK